MKFLHLSTGDVRGAYTGAYRLHENLKAAGHESKMFVFEKTRKTDPDLFSPPELQWKIFSFVLRVCNAVCKRLMFNRHEYETRYFFPYWGVVSLGHLFRQITFKPDLIIVNFTADFLSVEDLLRIQKHFKAPIAFYLMDVGWLTGGCHYPWDCEGYQKQCGNCPVLRRPHPEDWSNKKWLERNKIFRQLDYSVIAGSSWLFELSKKSSLHKGHRIDKILLGLDSELFRPRTKRIAIDAFKLQITEDDIVVYFGAQMLNDPRKGFSYLLSAFDALQNIICEADKNKVVLLTIGSSKPEAISQLPYRSCHVPYIKDKELFALTYNLADVYVCPSIEDAGPMMINEAVISGTPVICFKMGVAEDLVEDGQTGFIASEFTADSLASALKRFIEMSSNDRLTMSTKCRKTALALTSKENQAQNVVRLTTELNAVPTQSIA